MIDWRDKPCKLFIGYLTQERYGRDTFEGKRQGAHRVAWLEHYGWIPEGQFVLHHCDNPPCIEITHLFLGDNLVNMQDKISKGRAYTGIQEGISKSRGLDNGRSKLTEEDVRTIRYDVTIGIKRRVLAARYNVSKTVIDNVLSGKSWSHVKEIQ